MAKKSKSTAESISSKRQAKFLFGFVVTMLGILVFVAIFSFLFTGGADRSIFDLSFTELLTNSDLRVCNPLGKLGAWISDMLVTKGVGIMAVMVPTVIIVIGLKILEVRSISLYKVITHCFIFTVWGSITLGFICFSIADDDYFLIGGIHGYYIAKWLMACIGVVGTTALILISLLIYLIVNVSGVQEYVLKAIQFLTKGRIPMPSFSFSTDEGEKFEQDKQPQNSDNVDIYVPNSFDPKVEESHETETEIDISDPDANVLVAKKEEPQDANIFVVKNEEPHEPEPPFKIKVDADVDVDEDEEEKKNNFRINDGSVDEHEAKENRGGLDIPYDPTLELSHYKYPTFDLLIDYEKKNGDDVPEKIEERRAELEANKNRIVETLETFKISIVKIEATIGPTVTLYEIVPAPGVKITRIQSLENDIAMSLAALSVRIIAPIPGKGTIGIEVPNSKPKTVSMLSVLKSSAYQQSKYEIPIVLGKTIQNETYVFDLVKTPHLLVAGATGQGKSVGLNVLITSILYKMHPSQVKLVLIDPKMVEFSVYAPLEKYFLAKLPSEDEAVITDVDKAKATLNALTIEMDNRYNLIKGIARNIKEYNEKFIKRELNPADGHRFLPYIIIIIDEYADLMMQAGKEIETPIARIAQKARAVGMHMVLTTQRPSTNVVTGIIKANFPSRIAFKVSAMVDSRTVLDASGAQALIGRGDMLVSINGGTMTRVQCAFVDTQEVVAINDYISAQASLPCAYELPEGNDGGGDFGGFGGGDPTVAGALDPMIAEAARMIVQTQKGSTSYIQRGLSLGFNRAGRIMDQLEKMGIVGPADGSKPRPVYVSSDVELDGILANFGVK